MHALSACDCLTTEVAGSSMARALMPSPGAVTGRAFIQRLRPRPPYVHFQKAGSSACSVKASDPDTFRLKLGMYLQAKTPAKQQQIQRCSAGLTASYENTRTHSTEPSETTVTERMFDRAARYASAAGPGMSGQLKCTEASRHSFLIAQGTSTCKAAVVYGICSWWCWW